MPTGLWGRDGYKSLDEINFPLAVTLEAGIRPLISTKMERCFQNDSLPIMRLTGEHWLQEQGVSEVVPGGKGQRKAQ
jgi:hypothetical protein